MTITKGNACFLVIIFLYQIQYKKKQSIDKGGRISGKRYERVLIDYHWT